MTATANSLVASYSITPPAAGSVLVEFGTDGISYPLRTSSKNVFAGNTATFLVAGMKADTLYHMRAVVTYPDGSSQTDIDQVFRTGTIDPARIPTMKVTTTPGMTPSSGVELISLTIGNANQLMALATDTAGNVVWYYDYGTPLGIPQPIKLLPNGHMLAVLYLPSGPGGEVREIDLAGNIIRRFDYSDLSQRLQNAGYNIQVYSIDHDIVQLPNGHLLLLISDTRTFTDLIGFPGQTEVIGNAIVDVDASNNPVWVWDAFDHLDVNRHPLFFPDWTHANALVYSPDDGNLLLSIRHQSWVVKIDYKDGAGSGDILWKLGYEGDFTLSSDQISDWFYAQHDANIISTNSTGKIRLAMFDNGVDRPLDNSGTPCAGYVEPFCASTAAIFDVDEEARTAAREWSYTMQYSWWGGSMRLLPNTNLFVDETAPADLNLTGSRVFEVTQTPNPTVVWQMEIDDQNSYRTIHLPSLYPGVQW